MARFLVVDDDADSAGLISYLLESNGHQVHSVPSGEEALELVAADPGFDLILLDIFLLGADGITVCERIKSNKKLRHIPVGMITSNATNELKQRSEKVGAEYFFAKPVDINSFAYHLEYLLDSAAE